MQKMKINKEWPKKIKCLHNPTFHKELNAFKPSGTLLMQANTKSLLDEMEKRCIVPAWLPSFFNLPNIFYRSSNYIYSTQK